LRPKIRRTALHPPRGRFQSVPTAVPVIPAGSGSLKSFTLGPPALRWTVSDEIDLNWSTGAPDERWEVNGQ
jgi:hypothetical protein